MTGPHTPNGSGRGHSPRPTGAGGASAAAPGWVAIGRVVGVFGLRGELRIASLTDLPDRFTQLATLYVGDEHTPYAVAGAREHKGQVLLRLRGIEHIEEAERLRGAMLHIPAAEIAPLPADQFYLHDLIGLRVEDARGTLLGQIGEVVTGAGHDLFVVRTPDGREVLLPAVKEFVKAVDLAGGIVRVEPIPGLFDDATDDES